jgi:gliding motility-associated lipoprotein GldH
MTSIRRIISVVCPLIITASLFMGCMHAPFVFQKEEGIPQNAWAYNFKPTFTFDITDTTADYRPFFIIRHTQSYPYCNIWVLMYIQVPGDTVVKKERVNITMAEPSGKWLGRGMGEIYEQQLQLKLGDSVRFNKKGTYKISFEQNMRVNPLPEVLNVGFRLEKTGLTAAGH